MLRIYRAYNSIVRFSKYEFYNKLLGDRMLLRVTGNRMCCNEKTKLIHKFDCVFVTLE